MAPASGATRPLGRAEQGSGEPPSNTVTKVATVEVSVNVPFVLAHPLTAAVAETLPVSPAFLSIVAACVVAGVARLAATTALVDGPTVQVPLRPWVAAPRLPPALWATRVVGVALLAAMILVTRFGVVGSFVGVSPVLAIPTIVLAAVYPVLVIAAAVGGDVWEWFDPWDSLGRVIAGSDATAEEPGDVRPALPLAAAALWFATALRTPEDPRVFGAALAVYSLVTLLGCLVLGRRRWLSRAEVFGLFLSWVARLRNRRLVSWAPPRGAAALVGVVAGGLLFGELRTSSLWGVRDVLPLGWAWAAGGLLACCAAGAAVVSIGERVATRSGAAGSVVAAAVPTTAGIVVALALTQNRMFDGLALLARLLGAPPTLRLDLAGVPSLLTQVGILLLGTAAGAAVAARRTGSGSAAAPAVWVACILLTVATLLITAA